MKTKNKPILFCDVDDVLALLHFVWYERYNRDYNDTLTEERVTDWNLHNFVVPECNTKIYNYLKDPEIYDYVLPRPGAKDGVNVLRERGYRVVFATSTPIETAGRKFQWLERWGFAPEIRDYIEIGDKSLLCGEFLFDDCYGNLKNFSGKGYLLTRPWNKKHKWANRVNNWEEFVTVMEQNKNV